MKSWHTKNCGTNLEILKSWNTENNCKILKSWNLELDAPGHRDLGSETHNSRLKTESWNLEILKYSFQVGEIWSWNLETLKYCISRLNFGILKSWNLEILKSWITEFKIGFWILKSWNLEIRASFCAGLRWLLDSGQSHGWALSWPDPVSNAWLSRWYVI